MRRRTRIHGGPTHPQAARAPGAPATGTVAAHQVPVALRWELANGFLALTATTAWRSARHDDYWSVSPSLTFTSATVADTSVPGAPTYVSRAVVAGSSLAHDTTYTFGYAIAMRTSSCTWFGSSSVAVTVGPDGCPNSPRGNARAAS